MPSLAARQLAAKEEVARTHPFNSWLVSLVLIAEAGGLLLVEWASWMSQVWLVVPACFAVRFAIAARRVGGLEAFHNPLTWFFTPRYSYFGLVPNQSPALEATLATALLFAVLGIWSPLVPFMEPMVECNPPYVVSEHLCEQAHVPPWATCTFSPARYVQCKEDVPWWQTSWCDYQIGSCPVTNMLNCAGCNVMIPILANLRWTAGHLAFVVEVMPVLLALLWYCSVPLLDLVQRRCPAEAGERRQACFAVPEDAAALLRIAERAAEIDEEVAEGKADYKLFFWVFFDVVIFDMDLALDLIGVVQMVKTRNFVFALVPTSIACRSLYKLGQRGGLTAVHREAWSSYRRGLATDDFVRLQHLEKSDECAPALHVQFYAFAFITSSEMAILSFALSLCCSLRSLVKAAYEEFHLGIDVLDEAELAPPLGCCFPSETDTPEEADNAPLL